MMYQNCQWCHGRGCLVCGSTTRQRLEHEAKLREARCFLEHLVRETNADLQVHPTYLPIIAEAIAYGKEKALTQLREERAHAGVDRFSLLELEPDATPAAAEM